MKGKQNQKKKNNQNKDKKDKQKETSNQKIFSSEETNIDFKSNIKTYIIISLITFIIIILIYFQYKYELNENLGINNNDDEDYYSILGLENGASENKIKQTYKKLSKIYHPDKHPDCITCKEKFIKITKAYENLLKNNDNSIKKNTLFSSNPILLSLKNYHKLVENSDDFWVILVFENRKNDEISNDAIAIFDHVCSKFNSIIKFGVIDIIKENNLRTYLPFNFNDPPSIYTHLNGMNEEIYQNIERISVADFLKFIEEVYQSKIVLLNKYKLKQFYSLKGNIIKKNEIDIKKDLDLTFFIFSSKNVIDLVVKDFQKKYDNCQIYQNEFEYYKDGLEIFKPENNEKVFVSFNNITNDNKGLIKEIMSIPIKIELKDDMTQKLQMAFEIGKKITFPKIYKNNFFKHCSNKIQLIENHSANEKNLNESEINYDEKIIDICIIELNDNEIKNSNISNDINIAFYKGIISNFKKNIDFEKRKNEDSFIKINYGYVDLEENQKLFNFYNTFLNNTNNKFSIHGKKYLIIDLINEKFLFRSFEDSKIAENFFNHISDFEYYEDLSIAFQYFSDYNVKDISSLFNIHKILSLQQIFFRCLYCHIRISYISMYLLIFLSTVFIFKYNENKAISFVIYSFIFSMISHFIFFIHQHYNLNE